MKRKKRPLWKLLVLCGLSALFGAIGGFLWGWHAGVNYAPPIIFSVQHQPPAIRS
jgi:hypothetical protein